MADRGSPIQPDLNLLFKPLDGYEGPGCHVAVWLPASSTTTATTPMMIMVHGGGFVVGSAMDIPFNQVRWWTEQGFLVASLEYRLAPHANMAEIRQDLLDGYQFLHTRLEQELEGKNIKLDKQRIVTYGGSAGGTISLNLVSDIVQYNESHSATSLSLPGAMIVAYPVADFNALRAVPRSEYKAIMSTTDREAWAIGERIWDETPLTAWAMPANPAQFATCKDPRWIWFQRNMQHGTLYAHLLREEPPFTIGHSPIDRIGTQFPPVYLLAAMSDRMVPVQQSFILKEKLEDAGVDLIFDPVDGASHGFVEFPSQAWPQGNDYWQGHILPACQWAKAKVIAVLDE